jgi:hypothetical protein
MGLLPLLLLIIVLIAVLPAWPHSRGWGYRPSGLVSVLLVVLLILLLLRVVPLGLPVPPGPHPLP